MMRRRRARRTTRETGEFAIGSTSSRDCDSEAPDHTHTHTHTNQLTGFANGTFSGAINGIVAFSVSGGGARVITDFQGAVMRVVGASAATQQLQLALPGAATPLALVVAPNEEWAISGAAPPVLARKTPFVAPY